MYENYEFPHVHTYEGDLGWLIHAYKKLMKDYADLLEKVTQMEDDYNNINPTIDAAIARMEAELAKAIAQMQAIVTGLENDVAKAIADMKAEVTAQLSQYFDLIIQLEDQVSKFQVYIKRYVDTKIIGVREEMLAEIKKIVLKQPGWNPVYRKVDTVEHAMDETYKFDSFGVTASWLAAIGITAQEIADMRIPAGEWDTKARFYLYWWWLKTHPSIKKMANPWTGEMDDVRHVLVTLIGMHQEGVTAQELADANLTVEQIADTETTAYDHDWTRGWFEALVAAQANATTKTRSRAKATAATKATSTK